MPLRRRLLRNRIQGTCGTLGIQSGRVDGKQRIADIATSEGRNLRRGLQFLSSLPPRLIRRLFVGLRDKFSFNTVQFIEVVLPLAIGLRLWH